MSESLAMLAATLLDVLPVAIFLIFFHTVVLRHRLSDKRQLVAGFVLVVLGLGLFLIGLEKALFPVGRLMAEQLTAFSMAGATAAPAGWGDYHLVYAFAFCIAFGTTAAEPALLAVAMKANSVSGGAIGVTGLRMAVALGVATGVALGCFRIVSGMPLHWFIAAGYLVVVIQTAYAPRIIIPLAYDSGGVSTSTVTVPVIAALGLGLAEHIPGRTPLLDGFGLIAFACLFPIMSVLAYAQLTVLVEQWKSRAKAAAGADEVSENTMEN